MSGCVAAFLSWAVNYGKQTGANQVPTIKMHLITSVIPNAVFMLSNACIMLATAVGLHQGPGIVACKGDRRCMPSNELTPTNALT